MSSAEIKFSEEIMNNALEAAILEKINEAGRDRLIKEAISFITKKSSGSYGTSPLTDAFRNACNEAVKDVVKQQFDEVGSEFRKEVLDAVTQGINRWIGTEKEKLIDNISYAITKAISNDY